MSATPGETPKPYKRPVSVLVLIHTPERQILLLERASHPGYWQSVTGSQEGDELLDATARREVLEETGIDIASEDLPLRNWQQSHVFEIFLEWRHRYAPGVTENTEHVFSVQVPREIEVKLAPREHTNYIWLPYLEAADRCFSASNAEAILQLRGQICHSDIA